jgi:hypothetical protein
MDIELKVFHEILRDALSFDTACHEVEAAFGIRLNRDANALRDKPTARYESPDETWLIEVSIPPDNANDDNPEIVIWYDDHRENSVLDSAITHRELNDLINVAWRLRCQLAEQD